MAARVGKHAVLHWSPEEDQAGAGSSNTHEESAAGTSTPAEAGAGRSSAVARAGTSRLPKVYLDLLRGTLNPDSPLALLRGNEHMWRIIFAMVDEAYERHIDRKTTAYQIVTSVPETRFIVPGFTRDQGTVFPRPRGININMMPIRINAIPDKYSSYQHIIRACGVPRYQWDRVMYLTIQEGWVPVGQAQRRPGLHIESPTAIIADGGKIATRRRYQALSWGQGHMDEEEGPVGGIFMASNVANSTKVWPVLIKDSVDVADEHGGIEHMRERLGPGQVLAANELCWFTDRTPHESLPLQAPESDPQATKVYRQFFRLVVGKISVWYSKHNTPNPNGLQPEAEISDRDKFESLSATNAVDALGALSSH